MSFTLEIILAGLCSLVQPLGDGNPLYALFVDTTLPSGCSKFLPRHQPRLTFQLDDLAKPEDRQCAARTSLIKSLSLELFSGGWSCILDGGTCHLKDNNGNDPQESSPLTKIQCEKAGSSCVLTDDLCEIQANSCDQRTCRIPLTGCSLVDNQQLGLRVCQFFNSNELIPDHTGNMLVSAALDNVDIRLEDSSGKEIKDGAGKVNRYTGTGAGCLSSLLHFDTIAPFKELTASIPAHHTTKEKYRNENNHPGDRSAVRLVLKSGTVGGLRLSEDYWCLAEDQATCSTAKKKIAEMGKVCLSVSDNSVFIAITEEGRSKRTWQLKPPPSAAATTAITAATATTTTTTAATTTTAVTTTTTTATDTTKTERTITINLSNHVTGTNSGGSASGIPHFQWYYELVERRPNSASCKVPTIQGEEGAFVLSTGGGGFCPIDLSGP